MLGLRSLAWIGLVSYGFYLYHIALIDRLHKYASSAGLHPIYPIVLVGSFVLTCACAAVSYYLLERPIMRRRHIRPIGRRTAVAVAPRIEEPAVEPPSVAS